MRRWVIFALAMPSRGALWPQGLAPFSDLNRDGQPVYIVLFVSFAFDARLPGLRAVRSVREPCVPWWAVLPSFWLVLQLTIYYPRNVFCTSVNAIRPRLSARPVELDLFKSLD
jgi:hypothetical protein